MLSRVRFVEVNHFYIERETVFKLDFLRFTLYFMKKNKNGLRIFTRVLTPTYL